MNPTVVIHIWTVVNSSIAVDGISNIIFGCDQDGGRDKNQKVHFVVNLENHIVNPSSYAQWEASWQEVGKWHTVHWIFSIQGVFIQYTKSNHLLHSLIVQYN
jgi:hypothetical protein